MHDNGVVTTSSANGNGKHDILPSFFIVGPPRTGTTWLHGVLSQCAWLSHPTKETRFFDKYFDRGLPWYRSHYKRANHGRAVGEVAPTYFASAKARERIAQVIPLAKIVCTFRDPVERVLSLYRLKRAYGWISWTLEDAPLARSGVDGFEPLRCTLKGMDSDVWRGASHGHSARRYEDRSTRLSG